MDDLLLKVGKELDRLDQDQILTAKALKALINKVSEEEVASIQNEFNQEKVFDTEVDF